MSVGQWLYQWHPPPVHYVGNISHPHATSYWHVIRHRTVPRYQFHPENVKFQPVTKVRSKLKKQNGYGGKKLEQTNNDKSPITALTLWMTMIGTTQSQAIAADMDAQPFSTLYKWKVIDFEFPTAQHRNYALRTGAYIPENNLPLGLEIWGNRIWITVPSWRKGVPATLATVSKSGGLPSPLLKPYPDWSFHRVYSTKINCSRLTSVFRVTIDPCGRLWVLDSGQIDVQSQPKQVCPPSIFLFDAITDRFIAQYIIPEKLILQDSLMSNIIVDSSGEDYCVDLHLYIADPWRFGLIVFRHWDQTFWKFNHPYFFPDPLNSNLSLHGLDYVWSDGIFGISLSPETFGKRKLFFHALSSLNEFEVSSEVLKNERSVNESFAEFVLAGESRGAYGQSSASVIDRNGVMYYGLIAQDAVGCWDTNKPYRRRNQGTVSQNTKSLVFPSDLKVDQEPRQNVWVLSNKLPHFQAKILNNNVYNYYLLYADTSEAVRGTVCDKDFFSFNRNLY